MKKRLYLLVGLPFILIIASAQQRPNIVFILADDCTSWDIGIYGSKDAKTPTIDNLAAEGMTFTKCYQATPVCSPTRQNILTGLSPFNSGAYPNHTNINPGVKTIGHYLLPLGYRVALGGKQHYGPPENFPIEYLGRTAKDEDPVFENIDTFLNAASSKHQPFCLFVCSNQPHGPYNKGDTALFDQDKIELPPVFADLPVVRNQFKKYLAEINYLDGQVKQTLDLLEKYKLTDNTVVVFASEQGNAFPFAKWTCYNAGLRSAFIVKWPGKVKAGTVSGALIEYSDITPTFIDIAGGKQIEGLDGVSLVPVLTGQKAAHKKYTYGQMTSRGIIVGPEYFPIRSVSNGRYRYIVNLAPEIAFRNYVITGGMFKQWIKEGEKNQRVKDLVHKYQYRPSEELYDDEHDRYNQINLIDKPEYAAIKNELKGKLKEWMTATGDKGMLTELLALEHMPGKASGYPVIIDTVWHKPQNNQNGFMIDMPENGYYTFYLKGPGKIIVDESLVVNNAAVKKTDEQYGIIALQKGKHSIKFQSTTIDKIRFTGPASLSQDLYGKEAKPARTESID